MKKLCSVILAAALVLSIAACNYIEPDATGGTTDTVVTSSEESTSDSAADVSDSTASETTREKETLSDIGDNYYKEPSTDDIQTDKESGIVYVKNQLLISCEIGTPKEKVEDICKELDAKIVGYIEITSDFQIEFNEDHTYKELIEIGKDLEDKYDFIRMASINTAYGISYD